MPGNFSPQGCEPVMSIQFFWGEVVKLLYYPIWSRKQHWHLVNFDQSGF
jgi:hypothetical protein